MLCNTDLLDEFSDREFGHADWKMDWDADGNCIVTFFKEARPEYLADLEEQELYGDDEEEELRSERGCNE
jgi:hypothetical protein